ncbi:MAG: helix-turn-helix domain-containing protein, partial [Cyanobium sp.]
FSVLEFGGLYGAGGIGSRTQPLLGERIEASLKPNRVVVIVPGDTLVVLAERHGTSVAVLRSLNPDLLIDAAAPLPVGSWLFIPRRRTTTTGTTAISSAAAAAVVLYTPETLAAHLGVTLATLENWRLSGYGPAWFQLGELIRYSATDVDAWLALQFEQAQG